MFVIFGLSFGSALSRRNPRPGLSNVALARQITSYLRFIGTERVIAIVDVPIAIAMNSMGEYPDRTLSTSLHGAGGALSSVEFFRRAKASLDHEPLRSDDPCVKYFLAAQSVCQPRAVQLAHEYLGVTVTPLTPASVECDPDVSPWHARTLRRAGIYERFASFIEA